MRQVGPGKQGAAGTGYATYLLRNTGSVPCTLIGFPGVSLLDAHGQLVNRPATRTPATPRLVTVPPGAAAAFVVTSNAVSCQGAVSRYESQRLRVYPPNNTAALTLGGNYIACELRVGPVHLN